MEIKKGDYVFITDGKCCIYKTLFGVKFLTLKPNKFYKVIGVNHIDVFIEGETNSGKLTRIKLNSPIFRKLTFIKEEDFKEINNVEYFEENI